jgi:SOS-response transcriptional repressor LexA
MRPEYNSGCLDVNNHNCLTINNHGRNFVTMKLSDRLKQARAHAKLSQKQLAEQSGMTQQMISKLERGEAYETSGLIKLAQAMGVRPEWLDSEQGEMLISKDILETNDKRSPYHLETQKIPAGKYLPVISWVQAGTWCDAVDVMSPADAEEWYPCPVPHSDRAYALKVRGISMEPDFREGELIFVDPDAPFQHRSYVIAKRTDEDYATFKQLIIEGPDRYLKALNPTWPEPLIKINEGIHICGTVIFHGRKL